MVRCDDALDLLLPDADAEVTRRAREVTRFLRLLCDDARRSQAPAVGIDVEHAHTTLEHADRARVARTLEDLLRHHVDALGRTDSFLWCGEARAGWDAAWATLLEAQREIDGLPRLPSAGEPAAASGARVLAALGALAPEPVARLWRARWAHATDGGRAAEPLYRDLLTPGGRERPAPSVVRAAVAGVAECLLDRGAVRDARAWLGAHPLHLSVDARLRQLLGWSRALLEDAEGARAALVGLRVGPGPVPAALVELRAARAELLPLLAGRPAPERPPAPETAARELAPASSAAALRARGDVGALALVVVAFRPGHALRLLHADAAPGVARRLEAWLAERDGACAVAGEREQDLVARAAPLVEHAAAGAALRATLGRGASRALALVPVLDDDGEAAGWLHLEFEHHLVPCSARLAAFAVGWRPAVLAERAAVTEAAAPPAPDAREDRCASEAFQAIVSRLGMKTAQRLWWGFRVVGGEPVPCAQGGEGQGFEAAPPGRARALARALATGVRIDFDECDARLSVHGGAASGVVLPLAFAGRILGLVAVESSRRRDFRGFAGAETADWAERAAAELCVAAFCDEHRERYGFEPWFDAGRADFRRFVLRLVQAARSRAPIVLQGPAGAGKLVLARWIHRESARRDGPLHVASCRTMPPRAGWAALAERAQGGTLVLDDVDALDAALQEDLLHAVEGVGPADVRIVATTRGALRVPAAGAGVEAGEREPRPEAGASTGLRCDLAVRLDRLRFAVPGLAERREEIPGLVPALARRLAEAEGRRAPSFADEALACLWRQPWPGNVRELENLLYKLVLTTGSAHVGLTELATVAREFGVPLLRRLPSRHPDRSDLVAALRTTATAQGRANKTRAASYLGWDPDTLVARLADAGLGDEVEEVRAWTDRGQGAEGGPGAPAD